MQNNVYLCIDGVDTAIPTKGARKIEITRFSKFS